MSKVKKRKEKFAEKVPSNIWQEIPSESNPYIAEEIFFCGYNLYDLIKKRSYPDVLFLLFAGELPTSSQKELFEKLLILLANQGPRHSAVRIAMNAATFKTRPAHILPIGMSIMSGGYLGGEETLNAMYWLRRHYRKSPESVAESLLSSNLPEEESEAVNMHIAPGFGRRFGNIEITAGKAAALLLDYECAGKYMKWGSALVDLLRPSNYGWLTPGIAAAAYLDLGIHPRAGAGLYQLMTAPGILAHGIEMMNKSRTAMPFVSEDNYTYEEADNG